MNELIRRLIDQVARRRRRGDETVTDDRELGRRMREERELVFVGGVFFVEKFAYFVERTVAEERLEGGQLFVGLSASASSPVTPNADSGTWNWKNSTTRPGPTAGMNPWITVVSPRGPGPSGGWCRCWSRLRTRYGGPGLSSIVGWSGRIAWSP